MMKEADDFNVKLTQAAKHLKALKAAGEVRRRCARAGGPCMPLVCLFCAVHQV